MNQIMNRGQTLFKKYFLYLIFYSFGGYLLERILNLIFYQEWIDNSVLIGPYQPLYGSGVLLTILIFELQNHMSINQNKYLNQAILLISAILFTGLVEAITGFGFEYLFNLRLWDYRDFFPCTYRYICIYPTTIFGITNYLVVRYLHPIFRYYIEKTNNLLYYCLLILFIFDIIVTFTRL